MKHFPVYMERQEMTENEVVLKPGLVWHCFCVSGNISEDDLCKRVFSAVFLKIVV